MKSAVIAIFVVIVILVVLYATRSQSNSNQQNNSQNNTNPPTTSQVQTTSGKYISPMHILAPSSGTKDIINPNQKKLDQKDDSEYYETIRIPAKPITVNNRSYQQ